MFNASDEEHSAPAKEQIKRDSNSSGSITTDRIRTDGHDWSSAEWIGPSKLICLIRGERHSECALSERIKNLFGLRDGKEFEGINWSQKRGKLRFPNDTSGRRISEKLILSSGRLIATLLPMPRPLNDQQITLLDLVNHIHHAGMFRRRKKL